MATKMETKSHDRTMRKKEEEERKTNAKDVGSSATADCGTSGGSRLRSRKSAAAKPIPSRAGSEASSPSTASRRRALKEHAPGGTKKKRSSAALGAPNPRLYRPARREPVGSPPAPGPGCTARDKSPASNPISRGASSLNTPVRERVSLPVMEFSQERRPSAASMVRAFAEWTERSPPPHRPHSCRPAESAARTLAPLPAARSLPAPLVFELVPEAPSARGRGDPDMSARPPRPPRSFTPSPQTVRPTAVTPPPAPEFELSSRENGVKQKMNVIDDDIPEKCSDGTTFASGDDENGNLQEMEVSEGTEGDECTSAPVELLAEFLSAVMQRDYTTALGHCERILKFEPNNCVAREFLPLISLRVNSVNHCVEPESGEEEEEEESEEEDAASNDDEPEESEEIKFNEEEVSDEDETADEDPDEESASEMEATSTSDGTTDNFSLGEEEDEHFSNIETKTDPNGNLTDAGGWQNTNHLISSDHKHNDLSLTALDSATKNFQNLTLEQLRAQFVNGGK